MDPKQIAEQFVAQYYQTFDTNRAALGNIYVRFYTESCTQQWWPPRLHSSVGHCSPKRPESVLVWEGEAVTGPVAILQKFTVSVFPINAHLLGSTAILMGLFSCFATDPEIPSNPACGHFSWRPDDSWWWSYCLCSWTVKGECALGSLVPECVGIWAGF